MTRHSFSEAGTCLTPSYLKSFARALPRLDPGGTYEMLDVETSGTG